MDLLRSSILGKEFINYRKYTSETDKGRFYRDTIKYNKIPGIYKITNMKDIIIVMILIILWITIVLLPFILLTVYLQPYWVFWWILWVIFLIAFMFKLCL